MCRLDVGGGELRSVSCGDRVRRGCSESGSTTMPVKVFVVASLFIGAGVTAVFASLRTTGISTVGDMKEVGESIRLWMRAPSRTVDSQRSKS